LGSSRIICDPPSGAGWLSLVHGEPDSRDDSEHLETFRQELVQRAVEYTRGIVSIAESREIAISFRPENLDKAQTLVMTGHQPEIYHPGILRKNKELLSFCQANGFIPLSISLDLDRHDAGALFYPTEPESGRLRVEQCSIGSGTGLISRQRVIAVDELKEIFGRIEQSIISQGIALSRNFYHARDLYLKLSGVCLGTANSIVRRALAGEDRLLELSFSELLRLEPIDKSIKDFLDQPVRLVACYNSTLNEFRTAQKIKNKANPFPDLRKEGEREELPFWVVQHDRGERDSLWYGSEQGETVFFYGDKSAELSQLLESESCAVVPKGALVTTLFRKHCCDLFIHGIGGGKYDRFTDQFVEKFHGEKLAPYVIVSEDRVLFAKLADDLSLAEERSQQVRQIKSHIADFLSEQYFSKEQIEVLRGLAQSQSELIAELKILKGQERSQVAHKLNAVKAEIAQRVDSWIGDEWQLELARLQKSSEAILFRRYPFFYFD